MKELALSTTAKENAIALLFFHQTERSIPEHKGRLSFA
jgi:hypothetical protein